MRWEIFLNKEKRYCEVITSGIADKYGSLNMAKAISQALKSVKFKKVLIDHSNITAVSGGITEVYDRPNKLAEMGLVPSIKIAEIVKEEYGEFFNFLKAICVSRGFQFAIFSDKENALEWLLC